MQGERDNTKFELIWRGRGGREHREVFRSFRRAQKKQNALRYHAAGVTEIVLRVAVQQSAVSTQPSAISKPCIPIAKPERPRAVLHRLLFVGRRWPVRPLALKIARAASA